MLDYLCCDIKSPQDREDVRAELYDHLLSRYEIDVATGMTEEEAEADAEQALGDRELLHKSLTKLHRKTATDRLRTAFILLALSTASFYFVLSICMDFRTGFFMHFWFWIAMLVIPFLCQLHWWGTDVRLQPALWLRGGMFFIGVCALPFIFYSLPNAERTTLLMTVYLCSETLQYLLLLLGLYQIVRTYEQSRPARRMLLFSCGFLILCGFLFWYFFLRGGQISAVMLTSEEIGNSISYSSMRNRHYVYRLLASYPFWISLSFCYRTLKWNAVRLEFHKPRLRLFVAVLGVLAAAIFVSTGWYINRQPETVAYTVEDTALSQAERSRICAVLKTYGLPDAALAQLPNSELQQYASALPCKEAVASFDYLNPPDPLLKNYPLIYNDLKFHEYAILLSETETTFTVRLLRHISYAENEPHAYRRRIKMLSADSHFQPLGSGALTVGQENDPREADAAPFLLLLYKNGDQVRSGRPLHTQTGYVRDTSLSTFAFEYAERSCTDVLFAQTYAVQPYDNNKEFTYGLMYECTRFTQPFSLQFTRLDDPNFGINPFQTDHFYTIGQSTTETFGAQMQAQENTKHAYMPMNADETKTADAMDGGRTEE
ncbi:MAG: hypothetical protein IK080_01135 [Clostridia bacterium]|nr:hypothetical protein [Clostridia bacterium]